MDYEQIDSDDTIMKLLEENDIDRNKYLTSFIKIMKNNGKNRIFSLDGNWGSGKTVFVRKLEKLIKYCSMYNNGSLMWDDVYSKEEEFSEEDVRRLEKLIKTGIYEEFNRIVKENLINCVYFNAWEHDDEEDPMISIIYALIRKYNLFDGTKNYKFEIIEQGINIVANVVGAKNFSVSDIVKKEDLAENIHKKEKIKGAVKTIINELIEEKCNKLIIFIDELDRCNPKYAVRLLERIKHYFTDERIIIVISTNLIELANTVSGMYGNNFSSHAYLDKFFDARLEIPKANVVVYTDTIDININNTSSWFWTAVNSYIKHKNLELREINRYLACIRYFQKKMNMGATYRDTRIGLLIECLFLPYIVGLHTTDIIKYNEFKNKNGWTDFSNYIESNPKLIKICRYSIYTENRNNMIERKDSVILNEIKKLYELMLDNRYKEKLNDINIGDQQIEYNEFDYIEDRMSILGALSDFGENEIKTQE